jgi:hypothetical protein
VVTHGNQKWTRESVIEELKAREARGEVTLTRGLQRAVQLYFGGAHAARAAAGLAPMLRMAWTKESLVKELQRRARRGDSGHTLWIACKRLFGSVAAARAAADVPARQREPGMAAWDRRALLAELRRRRKHQQPLGRGLIEGLRREFGSLAAARALAERPRRGRAGAPSARQQWSRALLIERLRAWHAADGGAPSKLLTSACKHHFGSVARACAVAGVPVQAPWTPQRIRQALRDPRVDIADPDLVAACIEHFGSVTAAQAAATRSRAKRVWSKATVIAELQARARRGLKGVGRLLRDPAIRLFGSTEAALAAAAQSVPLPGRRPGKPGAGR